MVSMTHLTHALVSMNLLSITHITNGIYDSSHTRSGVYESAIYHSYNKCYLSLIWHTLCCSVLQCVAVCCSVLQCVAVCCSALVSMNLLSIAHMTHALYHSYPIHYGGMSHLSWTYMGGTFVYICVVRVSRMYSYVCRICSWVCRTHA